MNIFKIHSENLTLIYLLISDFFYKNLTSYLCKNIHEAALCKPSPLNFLKIFKNNKYRLMNPIKDIF